MNLRRATVSLAALVGLTLSAWLSAGPQVRQVDEAALKNAGKTGDEWLTYGLTQAETRYSPLNQINAGTVKRLGLAWSYDLGSGGGGQEATPLVWNGMLFGITNWSVVFAVDARTGKERWRWDPEVNQTAVRPEDLLRRRQSRHRALRREDHRAGHRRPAAGARRRDRQGDLGSARRVSAGPPHDHDGAADRQGQGDHRRERRRSPDAWILRRLRCDDRTARVALLYGARRSVQAVRERRDEEGGRDLGRRLVEEGRRRRGVGRHGLRPGGGAGLCRHRQRRAVGAAAPHRHRQRQPLCLLDPRGGRRHRRVEVALPGRAERHLGLRQRAASDAGRPDDQRPPAQGDHAGEQERVLLRDRSDHGPVHLRRPVFAA